jgi:tetratricopeptide (TPR) repeat protein
MKNYYLKLRILYLLIFKISAVYCQTASDLIKLARQEVNIGNTQNANNIYERISFFNSEILNSNDFKNWAQVCIVLKENEKAIQLFQRAIGSSKFILEQNEIRLEMGVMQLSNSDFNVSIATFLSINDNDMSKDFIEKKNKLLAISYFGAGNFIESGILFENTIPEKSDEIKSIFIKVNALKKRYNPKKAKILNMIIPGLGYFYLGQIWKGVNSLTLNASLVGLGIVYAKKVAFFDSIITMFSPIQRYYVGGFTRAEIAAKDKITLEQNKNIRNLIDIAFN